MTDREIKEGLATETYYGLNLLYVLKFETSEGDKKVLERLIIKCREGRR